MRVALYARVSTDRQEKQRSDRLSARRRAGPGAPPKVGTW